MVSMEASEEEKKLRQRSPKTQGSNDEPGAPSVLCLMWACESFLVRSKAVWKIWDSSSRPLAEGVQVGEQPGGAAAEGVPGAEQGSGDIAAGG